MKKIGFISRLGAWSAGGLSIAASLAAVVSMLTALPAAAQFSGASRHIDVELKAETTSPAPGQRIRVAFLMNAQLGWHGYWVNPGESGAAPSVQWKLPPGASAGDLKHPTPKTLKVAGMVSYVHEGEYALTSHIKLPSTVQVGSTVPISATLNWLACSDQACVPEKQTFSLNLTVADGKITPDARRSFTALEAKLPRSSSSRGEVALENGKLHLALAAPPGTNPATARIYPLSNDYFEPGAAQTVRLEGGKLVFTVATSLATVPSTLEAIVSPGPNQRSLAIVAVPTTRSLADKLEKPSPDAPLAGATSLIEGSTLPSLPSTLAAPTAAQAKSGQASAPEGTADALLLAFLGALVGGLILNLMPCVFPILSLKALSISRSGETEASARTEAMAYSLGAILVCVALGAVLIFLRSAGAQVGWAFQLQDPRVVLGLLLLTFGIALNLSGLFELPGINFGNKLASKPGASGAFWTGGLAAFVATPCSGPFMGAALGAALLLPAPSALLVFAGLGVGLALPFLLIGFVPALRSRLPKPGPWMSGFRQILAVPMFLTSVGLAWVLGRQSGVDGMTLGLASAAALAFGLWLLGRRQRSGASRPILAAAPLVILAASAVILVPISPPLQASGLESRRAERVERFRESRLAELRSKNVPVFVDFTADWCLSCKVNEKLAINTERTQKAFADAGVVTLIGDWTNGDPAITAFLEKHRRNSIPYYLFYAPGQPVKELPQILTPTLLEQTARSGVASKGAA